MNATGVKVSWNEQKGKLKQKFGLLADNDLLFETGMKMEIIDKLQIKLGKTREELHKIIKQL